jgi:iduronate 2-sulfatase
MKITLLLAPALLLLATVSSRAADAGLSRPNILFLVADDLAVRLGCYGDRAAITPNLDRLAGEGVRFARAFAQGSVCIPSRTSFMLGLNNRHAKSDHFLRNPDTMTLGRWFREHGYQTFSVGKVDHTEEYTDPKAWDIRVPISEAKPTAEIGPRLRLDEDRGRKRATVLTVGLADRPEALDDWARTAHAIQFLEKQRDPARPFFAVVGFHTPHTPWDSTKAIHEAHDPAKFLLESTPATASPLPPRSLQWEPGLEMSEGRQRESQRAYYAAVTELDAQIGRLLARLQAAGLAENTVVVFTSDQGYHLGWRGQWYKHTLSEQVLRVPLIVRHPQGAKGAVANGIVELLDLFPTFCDLAGLPAPASLDGKSFRPLLADPKAEGKPAAFCWMPAMWGNGRTVRTERWRLIERADGSRELYDLDRDPLEYHNVIGDRGHAAVVMDLHAMLEKEFGPLPKPAPAAGNKGGKKVGP